MYFVGSIQYQLYNNFFKYIKQLKRFEYCVNIMKNTNVKFNLYLHNISSNSNVFTNARGSYMATIICASKKKK